MKTLKLKFLIINIFMLPLTVFAQSPGNNYQATFSNILKEAYDKNVFSGSVLIEKNGNIIFRESIGKADESNNIDNAAETKFRTGSITKTFTKVLIHQLAEENKINMSDKLGKYLSGFSPEASENVTIQQLTDHTSGFGDFFSGSFNSEMPVNINNISDVLPIIQKEEIQFTPGSKTQYSNSGYVILANIIEKIEGKEFEVILKERIFDKTGMSNTGFKPVNTEIKGKAKGYLSNQLGPRQDNSGMNIIGAGAGGIYSTTEDMYKFAHSLSSDNILLSDEFKVKFFNSPLFPVQYANWQEFKKTGRFAVAGGAPGISAVMGINMEKDYITIVLSNYDEGSAEEVFKRFSAVLNDREAIPFNPPPAQMIYNIIKEKGANNFVENFKPEMSSAGIQLENDMILLFAGQEFLRENDADNAIALYTVYTNEFPNIVIAWNDMGDAYLLKGDNAKARHCYEQALKIRPANIRAKESLEKIK